VAPEDLLSPALREAERAIDEQHASNPLFNYPRASSLWAFLAACEEHFVRQAIWEFEDPQEFGGIYQNRALADNVVNFAKWPMRWLIGKCSGDGPAAPGYDPERYEAARQMTELADDYLSFEAAFSYASWGVCQLHLDGKRIMPSGAIREDTRYEAYDRFQDVKEKSETLVSMADLAGLVAPSLRVKGRTFSYHIGPKLVRKALEWASPAFDARFSLPEKWELHQYTLGDASSVLQLLWVLSSIHFAARMMAAAQGCMGLGYDRALIDTVRTKLIGWIARYSGRPPEVIERIVSDITYGKAGVHTPDIALQPIVELEEGRVVWAPNIVIHSALERNLVVLINRSPEGRDAYSRLSRHRETILRDWLVRELKSLGYRCWWGDVGGWQPPLDIDLAIVAESEKACLLLELKSFLAPADVREIREKGEEIGRGIEQIRTRRELAHTKPAPLFTCLNIDESYQITCAVVSENSIGPVWIQCDDVPVIRASHFMSRLRTTKTLRSVMNWLVARDYLPQEGRDFETVEVDITIGEWTLAWHGIKVLGEE